MKTYEECLREFEGLKQAEQPGYLVKHGSFLTLNALTFPGIPYPGAIITTHSGTLLSLYGLRDVSQLAMNNYETEVALCVKMMLANYDNVDGVSLGDGTIIAKAGVKATSTNTTRTLAPSTPTGVKYVFVDGAGEMQLSYDSDKLAYGAVILTFTDPFVIVEKTGTMQLKITINNTSAPVVIFLDLTTTIKALIEHLTEGTKINSKIALFNPNGFSPLGGPAPVTVPR